MVSYTVSKTEGAVNQHRVRFSGKPPTYFWRKIVFTNINSIMLIHNNPPTKEDLSKFKSREMVTLICPKCKCEFFRTKHNLMSDARKKKTKEFFCSCSCARSEKKEFECSECGKKILRNPPEIRRSKSKNFFCCRLCSYKYFSKIKTKMMGEHRSKLEIYIEQKIIELYGSDIAKFNDISVIGSELDIYIPQLNLAFELNGIFHYEPIFGNDKLNKVQNNDNRKFQACLENNIELCIIDTMSQKCFSKQSSRIFIDIITSIIDKKLLNK